MQKVHFEATVIQKLKFQTEMVPLFRKKLSVRIPQSHFYDASEPDQNVYRNMKIAEKMALFVVNSEKSAEVLKYLIDNEVGSMERICVLPKFSVPSN